MMKRALLAVLMLASFMLFCGCASVVNPLVRAEATDAPGLSNELHSAQASQVGAADTTYALYYRFLDEPMLAAEYRTLNIRRDERPELAVINALLAGPSAAGVELTRLFPEDVRVESVSVENNILFVTFNDALLTGDAIPEDWLTRPEWRDEAPVMRRLTIQSLVSTITESFTYTGVQIMVRQSGGARQNLRLDNSYFLSELTGPSEPQTRDENCILTPHNTLAAVINAYISRDMESLYKYVAVHGEGELKPAYDAFVAELKNAPALLNADISHGSVSPDGSRARLTVRLTFLSQSASRTVQAYPLSLIRENGIWKITFESLIALVSATGGILK